MVQRYDPDEYQGALPDDDGEYVLYEEYTVLEQRIEKAKQILAMGHTQRECDAYAALTEQEGK